MSSNKSSTAQQNEQTNYSSTSRKNSLSENKVSARKQSEKLGATHLLTTTNLTIKTNNKAKKKLCLMGADLLPNNISSTNDTGDTIAACLSQLKPISNKAKRGKIFFFELFLNKKIFLK